MQKLIILTLLLSFIFINDSNAYSFYQNVVKDYAPDCKTCLFSEQRFIDYRNKIDKIKNKCMVLNQKNGDDAYIECIEQYYIKSVKKWYDDVTPAYKPYQKIKDFDEKELKKNLKNIRTSIIDNMRIICSYISTSSDDIEQCVLEATYEGDIYVDYLIDNLIYHQADSIDIKDI